MFTKNGIRLFCKPIDFIQIPALILKLYFFISYFKNYLPYDEQKWTSKRNGKANEFEYNFLIICRYWDLVKNQRMIS